MDQIHTFIELRVNFVVIIKKNYSTKLNWGSDNTKNDKIHRSINFHDMNF